MQILCLIQHIDPYNALAVVYEFGIKPEAKKLNGTTQDLRLNKL